MTLIYGILGTIELLSGTYLIIILKKEFKGYIKQHKIYRIKKIQAIPFSISKFYKLDEAMVTYYLNKYKESKRDSIYRNVDQDIY
jgi:hypothetical protein